MADSIRASAMRRAEVVVGVESAVAQVGQPGAKAYADPFAEVEGLK